MARVSNAEIMKRLLSIERRLEMGQKISLTVREAAECTGLGINHLYRLANAGAFEVFRPGRRKVLILRTELERYIKENSKALMDPEEVAS